MDFIQLNNAFIRTDSILHVYMYNRTERDYVAHEDHTIPMIRITTKELQSNTWGEFSGSESVGYDYAVSSLEGQALLAWLKERTTTLVSSDILEKLKG